MNIATTSLASASQAYNKYDPVLMNSKDYIPRIRQVAQAINAQIPTLTNFEEEDPELAEENIQMAKLYEVRDLHKDAIEAYKDAFLYTKKPEDYLHIPELYETLKEWEKATLANLHLADAHLGLGKVKDAFKTLMNIKRVVSLHLSTPPKIDSIIVGLGLSKKPSQEQIDGAFSIASKQTDPEEAICIYKQLIARDPYQFEAYTLLGPLLKGNSS